MDPSEDVLMTMAIPPVVEIPGPGTYVVQLSVDDTPMARRKFRSVYPGNKTRPPQTVAPDQLEDAGGGGDARED